METSSISITQQLSFSHLFAFFARMQLHPSSYGTPEISIAIGVISVLIIAKILVNPLIILGVVMLVALYHTVISPLIYALNFVRIYSQPAVYTFAPEEVTIENPFFKLTFKWSQIARIVESKSVFRITTATGAFHEVLKSAIPPEQLDPLRQKLRDMLGDRAKV